MLLLWQALVLGALQGVAELFPVSSLAQTILLPALLGWKIHQKGSDFLAFVVALHLATALALVIYFWHDWRRVIVGFFGGLFRGQPLYNRDARFAWLLIAGTVVVGIVGLAAEKKVRELFDNQNMAWIVACILAVNGLFMLFGDAVKRRAAKADPAHEPEHADDHPHTAANQAVANALAGGPIDPTSALAQSQVKHAEDVSFPQAFVVGASQCLALLPGISRSGVTIIGGLWAGLTYEQSSRFAFMLATPVIGAAALLKIPSLLKESHHTIMMAVYGSIVAFVAAYLSVRFLMRYFHNNRLTPFGYFCLIMGVASAIYLKMHHV